MEPEKQAFCSCLHWRFFYLALLIWGAASHVLAQSNSPTFDCSRSYPALGGTSVGAVAVATGDFNGDGKHSGIAWRDARRLP
jgi:hypothetical protein